MTTTPGKRGRAAAWLAAAACLAAAVAVASPPGRILVLTARSGAPYDEVLAGFQNAVSRQGGGVEVRVVPLEGGGGSKAAQEMQKEGVALVAALGTSAASLALKEGGDLPVVAGMVLRPEALGKGGNAAGVLLEFPIETQFTWMRRFLPDCKTVGFLYNPKENRAKAEVAAAAAKKMGFRLESQEVRSVDDLAEALDALGKKVDVVWGVPDEVVFSPAAAKQLIPWSMKQRVPIVGISSAWVKAGALYSLDCDYKDLGAQCGEMAVKVLKGAKPSSIPHGTPRTVLYSLNMNTAREMKIEIPDALARSARQVY